MWFLFTRSFWQPLLRLRDPVKLEYLTRLVDPERFIHEVFLATGRNLAVAAGCLNSEVRREGRIAFLCCRALDAHEDLNSDSAIAAIRVRETADYFLGKSPSPPQIPSHSGNNDSDQLEFLIASRLPWVRGGLVSLPPSGRQRVEELIADLGEAMSEHLSSGRHVDATRQEYGNRVLGRVVRYALDLMGIEATPEVDLEVIGRLCQAVNDLRDLNDDVHATQDRDVLRVSLWLEVIETASVLTTSLRSLRFQGGCGTRAALVYMVATTLKALTKQANFPLVRLTRFPVWCMMTALSRQGYLRFLVGVDRTILGVIFHRSQSNADASKALALAHMLLRGSRQDAFEAQVADQHPDPAVAMALKRGCRIFRLSLLLVRTLPRTSLSQRPPNNPDGPLLMLSDNLMVAAITNLNSVGLGSLVAFCRVCNELINELEAQPGPTDPNGCLAAFLTEIVETARGSMRVNIEQRSLESRVSARRLHRVDQKGSFISHLRTLLWGKNHE